MTVRRRESGPCFPRSRGGPARRVGWPRGRLRIQPRRRGRPGFGGIAFQDRDGFLHDDRSVVVEIVGKVDRAATQFHPAGQDRRVDFQSIKPLPQNDGMSALWILSTRLVKSSGNADQRQKARQRDEIDLGLAQQGKDAVAELFHACTVFAGNDFRPNAGFRRACSRPPQSGRLAMTMGISACNCPALIRRRKLTNVVPPPEMSTPSRIGRSSGLASGRR